MTEQHALFISHSERKYHQSVSIAHANAMISATKDTIIALVNRGDMYHRISSQYHCDNNMQRYYHPFLFFIESSLMTPIAILYLCCIEITFMVFALLSTIWLFFAIMFVKLTCRNINEAGKCDLRDFVDKKVFEDWLSMNRTEIVGYRRLQTLSQLFF